MSGTTRLPMAVLSQQLAEAIRGRSVRSGVFTTFTFDPGFFELHVLPILFDQPFSQVDKIRRIQLEDRLSSADFAVYYDRDALSQDAEPAQLDYRRIDVGRATGCFHPKVILLLVDEPSEGEDEPDDPGELRQSLIVAILSANLTRAGWWESVEVGHIEEVVDWDQSSRRCSFRSDLLSLVRRIRDSTGEGEDHSALDSVHDFLRRRVPTGRFEHSSNAGRYYTRIFLGQQKLSEWLRELHIHRREWNLEVITPFFDPGGAGPLPDLIDALQPRECRLYLPREADGTALVTQDTYRATDEIARWGKLPSEVLQRSSGLSSERVAPRRVHAKVYRLWSRDGADLLLIGSVNLTQSAHSHARAGNLEAAFLVDVTDRNYPRRWWLEPLDADAERFLDLGASEEDGLQTARLELSLRYDWLSDKLAYRLEAKAAALFEIAETSGPTIATIQRPRSGKWVNCSREASSRVRELLLSSSFLLIKYQEAEWRVLLREENMSQRPSLLLELTPEEILEYWSLLTPEQRIAYLEEHAGSEGDLEGLAVSDRHRLRSRNTLFDRFAGIYHGFGCLRSHAVEAIEANHDREAEARLLGAKYDSLPALLEKTWARSEADPVTSYVTFLCAKQLRDSITREYPEFFATRKTQLGLLDRNLGRLAELRRAIRLEQTEDVEAFQSWYEEAFTAEITLDSSD